MYKIHRELIRQKLTPGNDGGLPDYVQVSSAAQPFTGDVPLPSRALSPFHPPDNITPGDLIAIIDAARAAHDAVATANELDEPICRIEKSGDDLRVEFGAQDGPLAGGGRFVIVRKAPAGYVADRHLGVWHS
ncbi:MAG: hypothetical protein JWN40_681 [Phycisphaerales bacterium]|nr:hypothetical protein [Phycisphaerales bacterium]